MNPYGDFDIDDRFLPAFFFHEDGSKVGTQRKTATDASSVDATIDPRLLQRDYGTSMSTFAGSKRKLASIDPAVDSSASSEPRELKRARKPSSLSMAVAPHDANYEMDRSSLPAITVVTKVPSTINPSVLTHTSNSSQHLATSNTIGGALTPSLAAGASTNLHPRTAPAPTSNPQQRVQSHSTIVSMSTSQHLLRAPVAPMSTVVASHQQPINMTSMQTSASSSYQLPAASNGSSSAAASRQAPSAPAIPVTIASANPQPPAAPVAPMTTAASNQPPATLNAPGRVKGTQTRIAQGKSNYGETIRNHALVTTMPPYQVDITLVEMMDFVPTWLQLPEVVGRFARNGIQYKDIAKVQLYATDSLTAENVETVNNRLKWQSTIAKHLLYPDRADERITAIAKSLGPDTRYTADQWKLRCDYKPNAVKESFEHVPLADIYNAIDPSRWPQGNDRGALTKCLEHARDNPDADYTTRDWATIIAQQGYTTPAVPAGMNRDQRDIAAFLRRCPQPT